MSKKTLFEVIESKKISYKDDGDENKFKIPNYITNNLKHELFEWQKEALENFIIFENTKKISDFPYIKENPTHLMFEMATGAGKTLVMAALILYYYKKGYKHFLFFTNQNNIVDKTENNFVDSSHQKYLFKPKIAIENDVVEVKKVDTFTPNPNGIQIKFTSIQKLYNDIHIEKENQTTLNDLNNLSVVMLADEAHHLNADTKKIEAKLDLLEMNNQTSKNDIEYQGWEKTVIELILKRKKADTKNEQLKNVLLEFTATLPQKAEVVDKYSDKIISKFILKDFMKSGFTKEINIISSSFDKKERILHALSLAWYRHTIALKYKIPNFKPVMLFRSKTIDDSKKDYDEFRDLISSISEKSFDFFKKTLQNSKTNNISDNQGQTRTEQMLEFIKKNKISFGQVADWIKQNYQDHSVIITNSKTNKTKQEKTDDNIEKLLNNLEDKDNPIRAIFSVDRLTEGWDVLNLYDIVRLYEGQNSGGSNKKTPAATISEKQLIGRGVRYYPFKFKEKQVNRRKFDNNILHELRVLEELYFYAKDEPRYISELKTELKKDGMIEDDKILKTFKIKDNFLKDKNFMDWIIFVNERLENDKAKQNNKDSLKNTNFYREFKANSYTIHESSINTDNTSELGNQNNYTKKISVKDIESHIFLKALNIKSKSSNSIFHFRNLKQKLDIESINELQKEILANWQIEFTNLNENEEVAAKDKLNACLEVLKFVEDHLNTSDKPFVGTEEFKPITIEKVFKEPKQKRVSKIDDEIPKKDWYVLDGFAGNDLEKEVVKFIEDRYGDISKKYELYLLRNGEVYKIYNFDDGAGFEPDFILLLKDKKGKEILSYQILIESKGEHLKSKDDWKSNFLKKITDKYGKKTVVTKEYENYRFIGLPFFSKSISQEFKDEFDNIIK